MNSGPLLPETESRYRSLIRTAPVVILYLAPNGRILEFNPEAERVYGCTRNETLGKNYLDTFISDRDRSAVADDVRKVLEGLETREL